MYLIIYIYTQNLLETTGVENFSGCHLLRRGWVCMVIYGSVSNLRCDGTFLNLDFHIDYISHVVMIDFKSGANLIKFQVICNLLLKCFFFFIFL